MQPRVYVVLEFHPGDIKSRKRVCGGGGSDQIVVSRCAGHFEEYRNSIRDDQVANR